MDFNPALPRYWIHSDNTSLTDWQRDEGRGWCVAAVFRQRNQGPRPCLLHPQLPMYLFLSDLTLLPLLSIIPMHLAQHPVLHYRYY